MKSGLESLLLREALLAIGLLVAKASLRVLCSVRVEAEQDLLVAERVLLLDDGALGDGTTTDRAEHALHLRAVDQLVEVWLGNAVLGKDEVALKLGGLGGGAVDAVESTEGGRGPDHKATEVTTRSELKQVQGVDVADLNTRDVAEGLDDVLAVLGRVNNEERTTALGVPAVPQLALASAELARALDLLNILTSTNSLEEGDSLGGLLDGAIGESGAVDDKRDLGDGGDAVATGEEKGSAGRGSDGGNGGEAPDLC